MPIFKRYDNEEEGTNMTQEIKVDACLDFDKLSEEIASSMNSDADDRLIGANGRPVKHEMSILPENIGELKHQKKAVSPQESAKSPIEENGEKIPVGDNDGKTVGNTGSDRRSPFEKLFGKLRSAREVPEKNTASETEVTEEVPKGTAPEAEAVEAVPQVTVPEADEEAPKETAPEAEAAEETAPITFFETEAAEENPQITVSGIEAIVDDAPEKPEVRNEAENTPAEEKKPARTNVSNPGGRDRMLSMNLDFLTVLVPIIAWSVYVFGARALTVTAVSVMVSVLSDHVIGRLRHRAPKLTDITPIITGITIALFLPVTVPLWIPAAAALISSVFVKGFVRGYGDCRLDPVSSSVCAVSVLFPAAVGVLCEPFARLSAFSASVPEFEKISETSLDILAKGNLPTDSLWACLFGLRSGAIGEISAVLLIAAGIYLVARKTIRPVLPVTFIVTLGVLCYVFPRAIIESDVIAMEFTAYNLLTGNLLPAVIFAAAMPGVSPMTKGGAAVAGIIGGAVTYAVRYFIPGVYADALAAVLIISVISRPLDKLFVPAAFGGSTKPKRKEKNKQGKTNG